jgi:putative selenate reductase molybdopterin-binding subunit
MMITLVVNGVEHQVEATPGETLLSVLRRQGYFGVKFGGCQEGECGACAVLFDGKPVNSCTMLAAQAEGHKLQTIEGIGERSEKGWRKTQGLHPLQQLL